MTHYSHINAFIPGTQNGNNGVPKSIQAANANQQSSNVTAINFRNMLLTGFGGQQSLISTSKTQSNDQTGQQALANPLLNGAVVETKNLDANALTLLLSREGFNQNEIDMMMQSMSPQDMISIINDPSLKAQITSLFQTLKSDGDDILKQIQNIVNEIASLQNKDGTYTLDVATMNAEEFEEWKEMNFSDLAAFFASPRQLTDDKGNIIEILQGPAFLHDQTGDVGLMEGFLGFQALSRFDLRGLEMAAKKAGIVIGGGLGGQKNINMLTQATALQSGDQQYQAMSQGFNGSSFGDFAALMEGLGLSFDSFSGQNGTNEYGHVLEAAFKTASSSANALLGQPSASQAHPASKMLAEQLVKMNATHKASGAEDPNNKQYRLQLDPPELGRIDIDMNFEASGKIRAHMLVERPETLNLLQRDIHVLIKSMQDAGISGFDNNAMSFDLAQGQNDPAGQQGQSMFDGRDGQNASSKDNGDADNLNGVIETHMNEILDPITGQKRINMVV